MLTFITVGNNFVASTTAYIGMVFDDLFPLIAVVLGLIIGFFIVGKVVSVIRGREIEEPEEE